MKHNYDWTIAFDEDVDMENNPVMDDNDYEHPTSPAEASINEDTDDVDGTYKNNEEDSEEPSFQEKIMLILN